MLRGSSGKLWEPVAYLIKSIDLVTEGLMAYLRAITATVLLIKEAD